MFIYLFNLTSRIDYEDLVDQLERVEEFFQACDDDHSPQLNEQSGNCMVCEQKDQILPWSHKNFPSL